ncbi:CDP-glycerol--poly(glycerophosphate) glycerophosphotransferase [Congregibacter litoralis]|uniref:Putative glycosyl/glycerophosphate transferase n=1 Tax=Congregibacter litoralis KT71 TaxID=314285 RepID=A4A556_9GAMM|nr:CDP-glycerol--poly(glycerophosphate) glycerophosphotransferase [Congregibacter litoralis]EAQ98927.1 putative glycosyl/glycerophosphate transferase [Congregibacter litoralis KT71]
MIRQNAKHWLKKSIYVIDLCMPKSKRVWAFPVCYLSGRLFDNARAIFEEVRHDNSLTKVVLYRDVKPEGLDRSDVVVVKLHSLRGVFFLMRSGVVFVRHCMTQDIGFEIAHRSRLMLNVWHGITMKKIGVQAAPDSVTGCDPLSAIVSSSDRDKKVMIQSFNYANEENTWITGLPRNDLLFRDETALWADAEDELQKIRNRINGRKLILFAPTFRADWEGWEDKSSFYEFSKAELMLLSSIAQDNNAVIGVRTHLREERAVLDAFGGLDVILFNDIVDPTLLLRETEVLVSDYSSIAIDFMLTKRPVFSFAFDFDRYTQGRGCQYDLSEVFPTPLCLDFPMLEKALRLALASPESVVNTEKYEHSLKHFHKYVDGDSTLRVVNRVIGREAS